MGMNYKDSGVDIEAGNAFVETLKEKAPSIGGFGGTQYRHAYHGYPSKSLSERLDTPYNLTMWQAVLAVNKGIKTSSGYTLEHWTNAQIELEDLWSRIQKRIPK